jgi:hypothetical protein
MWQEAWRVHFHRKHVSEQSMTTRQYGRLVSEWIADCACSLSTLGRAVAQASQPTLLSGSPISLLHLRGHKRECFARFYFGCSRPHRRCWLAGPDLGEQWSSRLVATASAVRLSKVTAAVAFGASHDPAVVIVYRPAKRLVFARNNCRATTSSSPRARLLL